MARTRERMTGRKTSGGFMSLPHSVLNSDPFKQLSPHGLKLLIDLFSQFRGRNNGDLCAAWSLMQRRNWRSRATLWSARNELLDGGWIVQTRQGGRNKASLYAVTWLNIDECRGKLDVAPTRVPSNQWRKPQPNVTTPQVGQRDTQAVRMAQGGNSN